MKWSDVPDILHGDVPIASVLNKPPDFTSTVFVDAVIQSIINIMKASFERKSEMDVLVWVRHRASRKAPLCNVNPNSATGR